MIGRFNPWPHIRRIEQALLMLTGEVRDINKRLRRLETMQFGYGPPPKDTPLRSYDTDRKDC